LGEEGPGQIHATTLVEVEDEGVVDVAHLEEEDQAEETLEGAMETMEEIYRHRVVIGMAER